jgi:hypothetical protein
MLFRRPSKATPLVSVNRALRHRLRLREATVRSLGVQLSQVQSELSADMALTTCPDCGSQSATSNQALANRRIGELERQNKSLEIKLLAVDKAIEELWLYPVDNFPTGDAAADITVFAAHTQAFAQQVEGKMASLATALARLAPGKGSSAPLAQ